MNAIDVTLCLRDLMEDQDGWGHEQGRRVHERLLKKMEEYPGKQVFRISLRGVRRTDASFPRESVVELARRFRGEKGFCLVDVGDPDLLDNWESAAIKREHPILRWNDSSWDLLGPAPSRGNRKMFEHVMERSTTTAKAAAQCLNLNLTNASTKLKQLLEGGFVLRREETATSGGVEYVYFAIR